MAMSVAVTYGINQVPVAVLPDTTNAYTTRARATAAAALLPPRTR